MHDCVVLYTHTTHRATLPATQTGVAPPPHHGTQMYRANAGDRPPPYARRLECTCGDVTWRCVHCGFAGAGRRGYRTMTRRDAGRTPHHLLCAAAATDVQGHAPSADAAASVRDRSPDDTGLTEEEELTSFDDTGLTLNDDDEACAEATWAAFAAAAGLDDSFDDTGRTSNDDDEVSAEAAWAAFAAAAGLDDELPDNIAPARSYRSADADGVPAFEGPGLYPPVSLAARPGRGLYNPDLVDWNATPEAVHPPGFADYVNGGATAQERARAHMTPRAKPGCPHPPPLSDLELEVRRRELELLLSISRPQAELLGKLLTSFARLAVEDPDAAGRVPCAAHDARRELTRGPNSVLQRAPTPTIHDFGPYAVVNICELLDIAVSLPRRDGETHQLFSPSSVVEDGAALGPHQARRGAQLAVDLGLHGERDAPQFGKVIACGMGCWVDGVALFSHQLVHASCEAMLLHAFGKVWLVMLGPKEKSDADRASMRRVQSFVRHCMQRAMKIHLVYDAELNRHVPIQHVHLVLSADTPARFAYTGFGTPGTSEYSPVPGWLAKLCLVRPADPNNVRPQERSFAACSDCAARRARAEDDPHSDETPCKACCNWRVQRVAFETLDRPGGKTVVRRGEKLTGAVSIARAHAARDTYASGKCTRAQAAAYLRQRGFNKRVAEAVLDAAESEPPGCLADILPPVWYDAAQLEACGMAGGHWAWLGLVKTATQDILDSLARVGKKKKLTDMWSGPTMLAALPVLSWLADCSFAGVGLWNGSHYRCYGTVVPWMCAMAEVQGLSLAGYTPPPGPPSGWTRAKVTGYMKAHAGYKLTAGPDGSGGTRDLAGMREEVAARLTAGADELVEMIDGDTVPRLMSVLHATVSAVMHPNPAATDVDRIDRVCKLFLDHTADLDIKSQNDNRWARRGNYCGLPLIAAQIEAHGSLRHMLNNDMNYEAHVGPLIKSLFPGGMQARNGDPKRWRRAVDRGTRLSFINDFVFDALDMDCAAASAGDDPATPRSGGEAARYDVGEPATLLDTAAPLSVVGHAPEHDAGVIVWGCRMTRKRGAAHMWTPLTPTLSTGAADCLRGQWYHKWGVASETETEAEPSPTRCTYAVLLPRPLAHGGGHFMVTSLLRHMDRAGKLVHPIDLLEL